MNPSLLLGISDLTKFYSGINRKSLKDESSYFFPVPNLTFQSSHAIIKRFQDVRMEKR